MAQDFERASASAVGTSETTLLTSNSDDALIGIRVTNILSSAVTCDCYIDKTGSGTDYHICKGLSIPPNSSVELIQGGAKIVIQNTDILHIKSDTGSALDVWVSYVDSIST
jgi:hypothetical protein|tara:strand:+ start:152 stop:484 length:333 start_codon:yes stop_codon:yes gene_type:complete